MTNRRNAARAVVTVIVATAMLTVSLSCEVENPRALFVYDAMAVSARQQCMIQPGQRPQSILLFGMLDVMLTSSYFLFPHARNMMRPLSSITGEGAQSGQVETNYLMMKAARVWVDLGELMPEAGSAEYQQFEPYFTTGVVETISGALEPQQEGAVAIEAIKTELGNYLGDKMRLVAAEGYGADINVYVELMAENQAGEIVYSNEFSFPIKVCYGCLIVPTATDVVTQLPCFPGQDYGVPPLICPAIANYPEDCPDYR